MHCAATHPTVVDPRGSDGGDNEWLFYLIGAVAFVIAVVVVLIVLWWYFLIYKKRKRTTDGNAAEEGDIAVGVDEEGLNEEGVEIVYDRNDVNAEMATNYIVKTRNFRLIGTWRCLYGLES